MVPQATNAQPTTTTPESAAMAAHIIHDNEERRTHRIAQLLLARLSIDDATQLSHDLFQKTVVGGSLIAAVVPLAFFVLLSLRLGSEGWTDGLALAWAATLLLWLTWTSINIVSRVFGNLPSWLFEVWLAFTETAQVLLVISFPGYPVAVVVAMLGLVVPLANTLFWWFHLVVLSVVFFIATINVSLVSGGANTAPGLVSDPYRPLWQELVAWQVSVWLLAAFIISAVAYAASLSSLREAASRREALLTRVVSEELCRFSPDTALVALRYLQYEKGVLTTARAIQKQRSVKEGAPAGETTEEAVDEATLGDLLPIDVILLSRLQLLIDRFERFIPHLPNWFVTSASFQGSQLPEVTEGALATAVQPSNAPLEDLDMQSLEDFVTESTGTPRDASFEGTPRMHSSLTAPPSSPLGRLVTGGTPLAASRRDRSSAFARVSGKGSNLSQGSSNERLKFQKISYAWLDFSRETSPFAAVSSPLAVAGHSSPKGPDARPIDHVALFVDAVHEAADATYGAVHKFVGDSVEVSWNTVRVTAQCEAKAARFMALIRQFAELHCHHMTVTGAAVTGDAYTAMLGSKQPAITVSFPTWRRALRQLAHFAARIGLLLIDEPTFSVGHYTVEARAIDLVRVVRGHDSTKPAVAPDRGPAAGSGVGRRRASLNGSLSALGSSALIGLVERSENEEGAPAAAPAASRPTPAAVSSLSTSTTRTMLVYEALRDLSAKSAKEAASVTADHPEEWMYTLANSERKTTVALRKAFDLINEDRFPAALAVLQQSIEQNLAMSSSAELSKIDVGLTHQTVRRLIDRIQKFSGNSSMDFAEDLTDLA